MVVGDRGTILTSSDGREWIERDSGTDASIEGITYGNGTFVAVTCQTILNSRYGKEWIQQDSVTGEMDNCLQAVNYSNNTLMAVLQFGIILTSP